MNFTAFLTIIATLFLLMVCGFYARKAGIIDDIASKRLSSGLPPVQGLSGSR